MRDPLPHRARHKSHVLVLVICGLIALVLPSLLDGVQPGLLDPVELWTMDLRFRFRPPLSVDTDPKQIKSPLVAAVDYDDQAARELGLGRWPWDRRVHAGVIGWLHKGGARAVMMDLLFDYPARNPDEDRGLAEAGAQAGNVFYPLAFPVETGAAGRPPSVAIPNAMLLHVEIPAGMHVPTVDSWTGPIEPFLNGAGGIGHIQRMVDVDGTLRRVPLLFRIPGGLVPALSLAATLRHLEADMETVRIVPNESGGPIGRWSLRFVPKQGPEVSIPIDAEGRTWINYAGKWGTRFLHFPYSWLVRQMEGAGGSEVLLNTWFKDRSVVLVNLTTGSADQGPIPFERDFAFGEVHLHLMNMMLTKQFLHDATTVQGMLLAAVPVGVLTVVALVSGPAVVLPAFVGLFLGILLVARQSFLSGVVVPVVSPAMSLTMALTLLLTVRFFLVDRERWRFLSILGSCLPPQTIRLIKQHPHHISELLAGRRRELTVLFADVKGFSNYCMRADPREVQEVLHDYLTVMTQAVRSHGGTLDKYMGDGVMAFFGDAETDEGSSRAEEERVARHAADAVRAALAMQAQMGMLNVRWVSQGRAAHQIRIGINTGIVTVGNLGTDYLWDYTVIGSEVNKAQRLEGAAEPGGILLAHRTYLLARQEGVIPMEIAGQALELKGLGAESDLHMMSPDVAARLAGKLSAKGEG